MVHALYNTHMCRQGTLVRIYAELLDVRMTTVKTMGESGRQPEHQYTEGFGYHEGQRGN